MQQTNRFDTVDSTRPQGPGIPDSLSQVLDDLFDKLDAIRVEQIVQLVSGEEFGQIFITDTNRKYLDAILTAMGGDHALFKVEQGVVTPMEE